MQRNRKIATDDHSIGREWSSAVSAVMLTIDDVAKLLQCSSRQVYRLSNAERMPRPVRLGSLVRWNRQALEVWISEGCPGRGATDNGGEANA